MTQSPQGDKRGLRSSGASVPGEGEQLTTNHLTGNHGKYLGVVHPSGHALCRSMHYSF